jgi:hypothetical protein
MACFSSRFAEIHVLGEKDRRAHLVGHRLGIAAGDVLLAVAEHGRDDILVHAMFAGAGCGGVTKVVEPSISIDTGISERVNPWVSKRWMACWRVNFCGIGAGMSGGATLRTIGMLHLLSPVYRRF